MAKIYAKYNYLMSARTQNNMLEPWKNKLSNDLTVQ